MFDLSKADLFRDSDIIITVKTEHCDERLKVYLDKFKELGMEVHAYSDRGCHRQYMLVPDREALQEQLHASCRNSAGGIFPDEFAKGLISAVSGEQVV
uniref:Uncharacterized protein n=1 Tax=Pseudomonas phage RVTF4 TaxID=3236931 RepID=A0AB39CCL3_9VIRU